MRKVFGSRLHRIWVCIAALWFGDSISAAEKPAQLRPLTLDGTWEIAATYEVTDKGWKYDSHSNDRNERVVIAGKVLRVYRAGRDKPSEEMEFKIVKLADNGLGKVEFSDKKNGMPEMTMLYRFEGSRLMLCMNDDRDGKVTTFGANGTRIAILIPYQHDRMIASVTLPPPKPNQTFQNVQGKAAPVPQPPPPPKVDE